MRQLSQLPQGKNVSGGQRTICDHFAADALLAAAPGSLAVWPRCDSAKVSGIVTSHAMGLPRAHGINVVPSGCLPFCCSKLTGIFDCRYLGPFDRPAQDVVHLVITLLPAATSASLLSLIHI